LLTSKYGGYLLLLGQSQNKSKLLAFLLKNFLKLLNITMIYSWYGWIDMLKICLAAWIVFVITTIYMTSCIWNNWLILYLIAKSSASVDNIFIAWWTVFVIILCSLWMCKIEVVILFLTLTLDIISIASWLLDKIS